MLTSVSTTSTGTTGIMWNGPICTQCGARYLGHHACSTEDILRRVQELLALLPGTQSARRCTSHDFATDRTAGCPCRPENGGSGACGCTLGGPTVTC